MTARLVAAVSMFTVIPVRASAGWQPADGAGPMLWLPVVGAGAGAVAALPAAAVREWSPHANLLGAVLAVGVLAAVTRCLHLDGLADTADGLASGAPAERALEIMRQSDIGPFGVVALILVLAADIASVGYFRGGAWAPVGVLAVGAATGRVAAVHASARGLRPARASGFGAIVAGGTPVAAVITWTVAVLGLGLGVAEALSVPPGWIVGPQAVALIAAYLVRSHASRRLGGVTGDVFGAVIELATAVTLIGAALR